MQIGEVFTVEEGALADWYHVIELSENGALDLVCKADPEAVIGTGRNGEPASASKCRYWDLLYMWSNNVGVCVGFDPETGAPLAAYHGNSGGGFQLLRMRSGNSRAAGA